jgi:ubiquinone/menaquinone biosynthesis C-methylase UbiE
MFEDFRTLNEFSKIQDLHTLVHFYLEHKPAISEELFIDKYIRLIGYSTEECYSGLADWYANFCVLPILREEQTDSVIDSQLFLERKFIEQNLMDNCTLLDVGCGPGRIPCLFHNNPQVKRILAFDISSAMLRKALELKKQLGYNGKITFFRGDVVNLQKLQLDSPVVATCMFGTLGNIPRENDRVTALTNLRQNAGHGRILLGVFHMGAADKAREYYQKTSASGGYGHNILEITNKTKTKTYFISPLNKFYSTWYTRRGIKEELQKAGLKGKIKVADELILVKCDI